ncbi:MAG: hypothetical protein Q9223_004509 [Gallowayella weberi]
MDDHQDSAAAPLEARGEDSEWEYEYDETETESFYVTVDISSASQQLRVPKKTAQPSHANANPRNGQEPPGPDAPVDQALQGPSTPDPSDPSNPQDDRLQILDLHTPNPLISYNGRIYSCTWASTIGTDIFLAAPDLLPAAPNDPFRVEPLHNLPNPTPAAPKPPSSNPSSPSKPPRAKPTKSQSTTGKQTRAPDGVSSDA